MTTTLRILLLAILLLGCDAASAATPSSATASWKRIPAVPWDVSKGLTKFLYDPALGKLLYYGAGGTTPGSQTTYSHSLQAYDAAKKTWQLKTTTRSSGADVTCNSPSHPGDRNPFQQMAYDTTRRRLYVYGGAASPCNDYNDTWYYSSSTNTWTQVFPSVSPAVSSSMADSAMAYDSDNDVIVLYGGLAGMTSTWHFSPSTNTWEEVATTRSPGPKGGHTLFYDPASRRIILFGGYSAYQSPSSNEVWLYDTATRTWTNPNPGAKPTGIIRPPAAFDTTRSTLTVYYGPGSLWQYHVGSNSWRQLHIPNGPPILGAALSDSRYDAYALGYDPNTDTYLSACFYAECDTQEQWWELRLGGSVVPLTIYESQLTPLDKSYATSHSVVLAGLTASTTYSFRVVSTDASGNRSVSSEQTFTTAAAPDTAAPAVTVDQAAGQADPTSTSPINFTAVFSEPVTGFTTGDVTVAGTAPGTKTATVTGSGAAYSVAVSGMTGSGTVIATIAAGKATDAAGNPNIASISTDNTVNYKSPAPEPTPAPPAGLVASGAREQVLLRWTQSSSSGVTQNKVYRSRRSDGAYALVATVSTTESYTDTSVRRKTTYFYVVTAVSSGGESAYSNQASARTR